MNELIQKLAEQAGFNLIRENCYDIVSTMTVQEFAELIVKECARMIPNTDLDDVDGGDSSVLFAAASQLRKHFGVK